MSAASHTTEHCGASRSDDSEEVRRCDDDREKAKGEIEKVTQTPAVSDLASSSAAVESSHCSGVFG